MPRDLLPDLETVRRASEWRARGYKVAVSDHGIPVRPNTGMYEFARVRERDAIIAEAIRTGKKVVQSPLVVRDYLLAGCDVNEFSNLPDDVAAFARGSVLIESGKFAEAIPLLRQATQANPDEVRYWEVYFDARLHVDDLTSIDEAVLYFQQDADSLIHSGRFEEWLDRLIVHNRFDTARRLIDQIGFGLQGLASGTIKPQRYSPQKSHFYAQKQKKFNVIRDRANRRIAKAEEKENWRS